MEQSFDPWRDWRNRRFHSRWTARRRKLCTCNIPPRALQSAPLIVTQEVSAPVRPQSAQKSAVEALKPRGVEVVIGDLENQSVDEVSELITGFDIIISAAPPEAQLDQIVLIDAAAKAGIKRFVPCGFTTISPPGGIMKLRDEREQVHQRIWYHHLPYTIVDVGYWHQLSWPRLPSGRVDYAVIMPPNTTIYGDGNAPNLMTDKRDMGRFVARIIKDDRTLNKRVFTHSDVLTQNDIIAVIEEKSGEKVETTHVNSLTQVNWTQFTDSL
jgi:hypothetical protein